MDVIEQKVNSRFIGLPKAIAWESWLRETDEKERPRLFKWNRIATAVLFLFTAICSIVIGNCKIFGKVSETTLYVINIAEFVFFVATFLFNYSVGRKLK